VQFTGVQRVRGRGRIKEGETFAEIDVRRDFVKDFPERRAELDGLGFRWNLPVNPPERHAQRLTDAQ
jgi:hypothetical protein